MMDVKGYAARTAQSRLAPFTFSRRDVGRQDVLISIRYCGICHSDVHQARDEWGGSLFPMVPGHEIVGVVERVGVDVLDLRRRLGTLVRAAVQDRHGVPVVDEPADDRGARGSGAADDEDLHRAVMSARATGPQGERDILRRVTQSLRSAPRRTGSDAPIGREIRPLARVGSSRIVP